MKKYNLSLTLMTLVASQVFAQPGKELSNPKAGVVCKVMTGNAPTLSSPARPTTDLISTKILMKENETQTITADFKALNGEPRPLTLKLQRLHLEPKQSIGLQPGGRYFFNNPFEPNSIFSRDDISGRTVVNGLNFVFEGEQNAKPIEAFLNTRKQQTFFSPYLIIKMTPKNPEEQLVTSNGQLTNFVVVICVIAESSSGL